MAGSVAVRGCRVALMPGLGLLLRAAPFLVGVVAAGVWLRRRQRERPQLEPPRPEPRPEPVDIVTVVDDLLEVRR
jgi:hypothetical protein